MAQALLNTARLDAPLHVLVADDSEVSRVLLRRLLSRNGYIAHEAQTGALALDAAEQLAPDLMLLDLRLPDIDGSTVLGYLRAKFDPVVLPIIMVSAEHDGEVIAGCLSIGANDYVTKPIHWPTLKARIATHIGVHVGRALIAAYAPLSPDPRH